RFLSLRLGTDRSQQSRAPALERELHVMTSNLRPARVAMALVHHANQYLITDGYENRQGITRIVEGYAKALELHERFGVAANLHLSGTLIETLAWHCPWFLGMIRELRRAGLVSLVGGSYSESVFTLFPADTNHWQLDVLLELYSEHLGCSPN